MEEPSVLDYVKSRLAFWRKSPPIEIPPEETDLARMQAEVFAENPQIEPEASFPSGHMELGEAAATVQRSIRQGEVADGAARTAQRRIWFPWFTLLPLVFALSGQWLLEPPDRSVTASIVLYVISAFLVVWGYLKGYLLPQDTPAQAETAPPLSLKKDTLWVILPAFVIAFFAFGGNQFNLINLIIWFLAVANVLRLFYVSSEQKTWAQRISGLWEAVRRPDWKIRFNGWTIFALLIVGGILFFRFYRLGQLPPEMVSDHAEKLLDVSDVINGKYSIFFPRNTGREAFQFYLTALVAQVVGTGISFMSLKIGTVLAGLVTVYFTYKIGQEMGGRWTGIFAAILTGVGYWPNIISRIGLRFPLYPLFVAPTLYYLLRGLRTSTRNDFIWAGLWLGVGLHGYTSTRVLPILVVVAFVLFILHTRVKEKRKGMILGLVVVSAMALVLFIPLMKYATEQPDMFIYRSMTRLGDLERPLPGPAWQIFLMNTWRAVTMFFYQDGDVWVHSIPGRPALDVISAALLFIGLVILTVRYIRKRNWIDLFFIVSIPILLLPSILSLAFPNENPNLNRTAGAYVPVFVIAAVGLDAIIRGIRQRLPGNFGTGFAWMTGLVLLLLTSSQNYDLVFNQYSKNYLSSSWNTSEMGGVIQGFVDSVGEPENAWVLAYPYWVDTRLVGMNAGYPTRDTGITPDHLEDTRTNSAAKLFIVNLEDMEGLLRLRQVYPDGKLTRYTSKVDTKDFLIYLVPPEEDQYIP